MPWSGEFGDLRLLVTAFLETGAMRRRGTRDLFLSALNKSLSRPVSPPRHPEDALDMLAIVTACLDHPGVLHTLVETIESFYAGSESVRRLRSLVDALVPEPLIDTAQRRELYGLVEAVERTGLHPDAQTMLPALYRAAVGPVAPPPSGPVAGIGDLLAELEDAPLRPDGGVPLLAFTASLAALAKGRGASALHAWTGRAAARLGVPPPEVDPRALAGGDPARSDVAYLMVEYRPSGADPRRFVASAWLQINTEPRTPLVLEDEPRPLHALPGLVDGLLTGDPRVVGRHVPDLVVEFVLPRSLLGLGVDQYPYSAGGVRRPLGLDYPVVVRSLERAADASLRHSLRRKWGWFTAHPAAGEATLVRSPGEHRVEQLYALLAENSKVCLALAFPPLDGHPSDELAVGLAAGTPIVLWCREGGDSARFIPDIRDMLNSDLMSLPQKIKDLRIRAAQTAEDAHLGRHLTLLFEDADRLPEPPAPLRPPEG
ncbi:hypothetical protein LO762_24840 [Actinocorallia sp. API 0066]|uniref:VMAP-C domain-containing protein n=1 Tax=Actinocorallia sp. API 0066 TaxID=2896846 RepID=UPI001E337797|nr:hypothetical protein [Actinocorallia sp. API 0066]MCD0452391.1 hypothetical protein [Actinocorallia sp. API 0066]